MRARELLPWRDITIDTSWPPAVVHTELAKQIDAPRFLGASGDGPFIGKSERPGHFRFQRRIGNRNSFLPTIIAVIEPSHHDGSRIRVRMRLHAFVAAFMVVWMTGATLVGIPVGVLGLAGGQPAALIGLALPIFGAALVSIPFALEARIAERVLRGIFEVAPALPEPPDTGAAFR